MSEREQPPERDQQHRWIARTQRALDDLESVAREILSALRSLAPESHVHSVAVPLSLVLRHDGASGQRAAGIVEFLHEQIRESLLAAAAFKRGRIYCLRCESTACPHAEPPGPRMVFAGYGETGRPEWVEIAELLAARRDARLERLFGDRRELVAVAIGQEEIYERLLPVFSGARDRYQVLAQLCVGRFLPNGNPNGEPMSLTVQAVAIPISNGQSVVGVNLIGRPPPDTDLPDPLDGSVLEGLDDALRALRRELSTVARSHQPVPHRLADRCLALIRDACRDLEHRTRVDNRRTRHARERSRQADRPTAKAFEDARQANDADVFEDAREHTIVVLGARGRTHFFSPQGKHVTSVVFPAPAIRSRLAQKRWRPVAREQLELFRRAVDAHERRS